MLESSGASMWDGQRAGAAWEQPGDSALGQPGAAWEQPGRAGWQEQRVLGVQG